MQNCCVHIFLFHSFDRTGDASSLQFQFRVVIHYQLPLRVVIHYKLLPRVVTHCQLPCEQTLSSQSDSAWHLI